MASFVWGFSFFFFFFLVFNYYKSLIFPVNSVSNFLSSTIFVKFFW